MRSTFPSLATSNKHFDLAVKPSETFQQFIARMLAVRKLKEQKIDLSGVVRGKISLLLTEASGEAGSVESMILTKGKLVQKWSRVCEGFFQKDVDRHELRKRCSMQRATLPARSHSTRSYEKCWRSSPTLFSQLMKRHSRSLKFESY